MVVCWRPTLLRCALAGVLFSRTLRLRLDVTHIAVSTVHYRLSNDQIRVPDNSGERT